MGAIDAFTTMVLVVAAFPEPGIGVGGVPALLAAFIAAVRLARTLLTLAAAGAGIRRRHCCGLKNLCSLNFCGSEFTVTFKVVIKL
jgi:hypothetical protein